MNKLLVFALMFTASITITTAIDFTDEELVQLYNTPVDPQAFIDTIFTLPLTEELYVYNYIVDLIRYLSPGSKLQNFLYSAMALMQRKIDDFSARYNLETKPVQDFLIKGIDIQLKILLESAHRIMKDAKNESSKTPLNKMGVLAASEDNIDRPITSTLKPLLTKSITSPAELGKITGQKSAEIRKEISNKDKISFPTNAGKPNENSFADLTKILEQNVVQNTSKLQLPKRNISKTGTQVKKTPLTSRNRSLSTGRLPLANSATPASFSV